MARTPKAYERFGPEWRGVRAIARAVRQASAEDLQRLDDVANEYWNDHTRASIEGRTEAIALARRSGRFVWAREAALYGRHVARQTYDWKLCVSPATALICYCQGQKEQANHLFLDPSLLEAWRSVDSRYLRFGTCLAHDAVADAALLMTLEPNSRSWWASSLAHAFSSVFPGPYSASLRPYPPSRVLEPEREPRAGDRVVGPWGERLLTEEDIAWGRAWGPV